MGDLKPRILGVDASLKFWFILLFILFFFSSSVTYGMSDNDSGKKEAADTNQNRFQLLDFFWGRAPKNGIVYLPFGKHTQRSDELAENNLIGVVYNSISLGTFINSFHERTWYLVIIRNIFSYHRFGIDYFAGVLYGYEGKLANVEGIPLRDTFLFKHDLNPILSFNTYYEIADHFSIQVLITPLVILSGIKYNF